MVKVPQILYPNEGQFCRGKTLLEHFIRTLFDLATSENFYPTLSLSNLLVPSKKNNNKSIQNREQNSRKIYWICLLQPKKRAMCSEEREAKREKLYPGGGRGILVKPHSKTQAYENTKVFIRKLTLNFNKKHFPLSNSTTIPESL